MSTFRPAGRSLGEGWGLHSLGPCWPSFLNVLLRRTGILYGWGNSKFRNLAIRNATLVLLDTSTTREHNETLWEVWFDCRSLRLGCFSVVAARTRSWRERVGCLRKVERDNSNRNGTRVYENPLLSDRIPGPVAWAAADRSGASILAASLLRLVRIMIGTSSRAAWRSAAGRGKVSDKHGRSTARIIHGVS